MWEGSMSALSDVLHHKWVTPEDLRALVAALQWRWSLSPQVSHDRFFL
jgi:hypothetical protein